MWHGSKKINNRHRALKIRVSSWHKGLEFFDYNMQMRWFSNLVERGKLIKTAPLKPSNVKFLWFVLHHHPPGMVHHPSLTLGAPLRVPKGTKITIFGLAVFLVGKEGNSPFKTINVKSFGFVLPRHPPRVTHHPKGPLRAQKQPKLSPR